jgi:hypothetical protein
MRQFIKMSRETFYANLTDKYGFNDGDDRWICQAVIDQYKLNLDKFNCVFTTGHNTYYKDTEELRKYIKNKLPRVVKIKLPSFHSSLWEKVRELIKLN